MRVAIDGPNEGGFGKPEPILDFSYFSQPGGNRFYDLSRDDRLLVMSARPLGTLSESIMTVINWTEELKRRVPVN